VGGVSPYRTKYLDEFFFLDIVQFQLLLFSYNSVDLERHLCAGRVILMGMKLVLSRAKKSWLTDSLLLCLLMLSYLTFDPELNSNPPLLKVCIMWIRVVSPLLAILTLYLCCLHCLFRMVANSVCSARNSRPPL